MPTIIFITLGNLMLIGQHGVPHGIYTATPPAICQTFESANAPATKAYCGTWFASHRRK
jgi:hypothetical protein